MRYLSVCSGIEAATCGWHSLGWTPAAFSEIEKFPSRLLAQRFPHVPNLGDMTRFREWPDELAPDILVGGTPCQSFSTAGLRRGIADPRGNLALVYLALADRYRPRWLVWENVPGVLSSGSGRDFGSFLGGLVQLGYGFAYRILDAQFYGVPQRRRRVFVIGYLGDWRPAAAVLFEPDSLSWNSPPQRTPRKDAAACVAAVIGDSGNDDEGPGPIGSNARAGFDSDADATPIAMAHGQAHAEVMDDGAAPSLTCVHEAPIVALPEYAYTLRANPGSPRIGFDTLLPSYDIAPTLSARETAGGGLGTDFEIGGGLVAYSIRTAFTNNDNFLAQEYAPPLDCGGPPAVTSFAAGMSYPQLGDDIANTLMVKTQAAVAIGVDCYNGALTGDVAACMMAQGRGSNGGPSVMQAFMQNMDEELIPLDQASTLTAVQGGHMQTFLADQSIPFTQNQRDEVRELAVPGALAAEHGMKQQTYLAQPQGMAVRRLTPRECERLQGFPDDYTLLTDRTPDGHRYRALGNSMAVPVMRWIGERIAAVDAQR